ncbi:MAG TPA: hypothetical protein VHQ47_08050 [Phycisphaerae bacterium]|nr:hypothetical protein [Phycisphaerae bacterium]
MGELSIPPLLAHDPEALPPGRWRILLLPIIMVLLAIGIANAAAISGQDARRSNEYDSLRITSLYWENRLAATQLEIDQLTALPHLDAAQRQRLDFLSQQFPSIQATVDKVHAYGLISYAKYGRVMSNWDGYRYEEIVTDGYVYHQPTDPPDIKNKSDMPWPGFPEGHIKNVSWYPLYPLMARGLVALTGISAIHALTIISETCAVLAAVFFFLYARRHFHNRIPFLHSAGEEAAAHPVRRWDLLPADSAALWALAFVLYNPCALFLYANYTESLFILLFAAFLYALQGRRWVIAALIAALASASRSQGVLFGPILAVTYVLRSDLRHGPLKLLIASGLGLLSEVGLFCFMAFLQHRFHDALAFMHAQQYWNVGINSVTISYAMNPVHAMSNFISYLFYVSPMDWPRIWEAFCVLWPPVVLMILGGRFLSFELEMAGWLLWGLPYVASCLAGYPAATDPWMSMGRFMAVMLPAQIIIGAVLVRFRWAGIPLLALSAGMFAMFSYDYGMGQWIG